MNLVNKLKFCFKGSRKYVHGTDIVAELIKAKSDTQLKDIDIKFSGISTKNLDMVEGQESSDAKVNICWKEQGEEKYYQLVENQQEVDCRYDYNESQIIERSSLNLSSKLISLDSVTGYTACENFVAMNKHLLQSLFPDEKGKWYFTRLEQNQLIEDSALIQVKLIKNFNFRLTKSDIILDDEVIGSVYFSMVRS